MTDKIEYLPVRKAALCELLEERGANLSAVARAMHHHQAWLHNQIRAHGGISPDAAEYIRRKFDIIPEQYAPQVTPVIVQLSEDSLQGIKKAVFTGTLAALRQRDKEDI